MQSYEIQIDPPQTIGHKEWWQTLEVHPTLTDAEQRMTALHTAFPKASLRVIGVISIMMAEEGRDGLSAPDQVEEASLDNTEHLYRSGAGCEACG